MEIKKALNTIESKYKKVWSFDTVTKSWKLYDKNALEVSNLKEFNRGQGYWLEITEDCTLVIDGNRYILKSGWNLIGWLG